MPVPKIQPWQVLVKLSVTSVCGTDIALAAGHVGPTCDILGHEGVGRVVRTGDGVDPSIVRPGDRVGVGWVRDVCGRCDSCREPRGETRCLKQQNSGRNWEGTFAEYCVIPSRYVLVLPDHAGLPDELIAPVLCGGVTAYKALKTCGAAPGDWVAILGAGGGVGALGVQYARAMGHRVAAVDVGSGKRDYCLNIGADTYLDVLDGVETAMQRLTDGTGAKAVIVTAGSGKAYQKALNMLAVFGTLVCVGIPPADDGIKLHPLQIIDKGIKIVGTLVGTRAETLEALDFVWRGLVKPSISLIKLDELSDVQSLLATVSLSAFHQNIASSNKPAGEWKVRG